MPSVWSQITFAAEAFSPSALVVMDDEHILAGGTLPSASSTGERAVILSWRTASASGHQVFESPGWLPCMARWRNNVWAIVGTFADGERVLSLMHSSDGGACWSDIAPVPTSSARQMIATGPNSLWLVGAEKIHMSLDQGMTWSAVPIPASGGCGRVYARPDSDEVLLLGTGLFSTVNHGQQWRHLFPTVAFHTISEDIVVATKDQMLQLGRLRGSDIEWLTVLPGHGIPVAVSMSSELIRVLYAPHPTSPLHVALGWIFAERANSGGRWESARVPGMLGVDLPAVALLSSGAGYTLGRAGNLYVLSDPEDPGDSVATP